MTERMEERVATLLKQAEDFRRHGEDGSADAAMSLAAKIMMKYSIDQAVIAARRSAIDVEELIVAIAIPFAGIYRKAVLGGMYNVAMTFGTTRAYAQTNGNVDTLHVVGYESDVAQLKLLFTSLQLQVMGSLNRWWQNYPDRQQVKGMLGYKTRRQYVISFMKGVVERVARSRQDSIDESSTALVVADRRGAIDAYMDEHYNLVETRSRAKPGLSVAADAGLSAGRQASTGETTVNGGRRQLTR